MKKLVYLLIALVVIAIAYILIPKFSTPNSSLIQECINICKENLAAGKNLTNGPCLANPMPSNPDWVCDVAHWPRQAVDNLKENQCPAYGRTARHFVEVTPNCTFIRAI